jgi:hypothetical protein
VGRPRLGRLVRLQSLDRFRERLLVVELLLHETRLVVHELPHRFHQPFVATDLGERLREVVHRLDLLDQLVPRLVFDER